MNVVDIDFVSLERCADELGYHVRHVRLLCERGKLGTKVGGRWLITRQELAGFKASERPHRGRPKIK